MMAPFPMTYRPCRTQRAGDWTRPCSSPTVAATWPRPKRSVRTAPNVSSAHNGRHGTVRTTTAYGVEPAHAGVPATVQHFEK